MLRQQGRAREAEQVFRTLLARLEAGADYDAADADYDKTLITRNIGLSLGAQGKPVAASEQYRAALQATEALEQTPQVRRQVGLYHTDLADVLTDMGQYAAAKAEYEIALNVAKQLKDDMQVSVVVMNCVHHHA